MKILVLLLFISSISYADDMIYFDDMTFSSVLKICENNTCKTLTNGNFSNYSNDSKVFEVNSIEDISPTGFLYNFFNPILLIFALMILLYATWRKRKND